MGVYHFSLLSPAPSEWSPPDVEERNLEGKSIDLNSGPLPQNANGDSTVIAQWGWDLLSEALNLLGISGLPFFLLQGYYVRSRLIKSQRLLDLFLFPRVSEL